MKFQIFTYPILITSTLIFTTFAIAATCTASPSNCPEESCTATYVGNDGGGVQCHAEADFAECESYDQNGVTIKKETPTCKGTAGGIDFPTDPDCQIYWWLCDPWAV